MFYFEKYFQGKVRFKNGFILPKETWCKEKNIVIFYFSFDDFSVKCFGNSIPIIKIFDFG